jgi:hypothetical protein
MVRYRSVFSRRVAGLVRFVFRSRAGREVRGSRPRSRIRTSRRGDQTCSAGLYAQAAHPLDHQHRLTPQRLGATRALAQPPSPGRFPPHQHFPTASRRSGRPRRAGTATNGAWFTRGSCPALTALLSGRSTLASVTIRRCTPMRPGDPVRPQASARAAGERRATTSREIPARHRRSFRPRRAQRRPRRRARPLHGNACDRDHGPSVRTPYKQDRTV